MPKLKTLPHVMLLTLSLFYLQGLQLSAQSLEELSTTVCYLEDRRPVTESINGKTEEVWLREPNSTNYRPKLVTYTGTGFFVRGKKFGYLVTAKHLALNLSPDSTIRVGTSNRNESLSMLFGALRGNIPFPWLHHGQVDVSISPFWLSPDFISTYLGKHLIEIESLADQADCPSRDVELTTLGFPWGLGIGLDMFSPISKVSKTSSGLMKDEQGVRYFMLQDPSIDGFSGSPVYLMPGLGFVGGGIQSKGPFKCVGLITATKADTSGGKMAIVIPSFYIRQMITGFESLIVTNATSSTGGAVESKQD